jgi:hypothetical protein
MIWVIEDMLRIENGWAAAIIKSVDVAVTSSVRASGCKTALSVR